MIQRIQTIYLLVASALLMLLLSSPLAVFSADDGIYSLTAMGVKSLDGDYLYPTAYLMVLLVLSIALPLVNIFMFKKRMLQIRLCVVAMVLNLGLIIMIGAYSYLGMRMFTLYGEPQFSLSALRIVVAMPLVAIIFNYLALKGIFKDEMLVKSLDRIR